MPTGRRDVLDDTFRQDQHDGHDDDGTQGCPMILPHTEGAEYAEFLEMMYGMLADADRS